MDIEQIQVDFNEEGKKVFFSLWKRFEQAASSLNRKRDDNVFQQLQGQYIHTLNENLESLVSTALEKLDEGNINEARQKLMQTIRYYTNEFMVKSRSL